MRKLLALALLLLLAAPAHAQVGFGGMFPGPGTVHSAGGGGGGYTLVSSGYGTGVSNAAVTLDSTGANFGVACSSADGSSDTSRTMVDDQGNTWSRGGWEAVGGQNLSLFYSTITTTNASHTVTFNNSNTYSTIIVRFYSGAASSSVADGAATSAHFGFSGTVQPGSITPSNNGSLLVSCSTTGSGVGDSAIDSGFTLNVDRPEVGGTSYAAAMATLIQGTAAAVNPTWSAPTWTGSTPVAVIMQAFKP